MISPLRGEQGTTEHEVDDDTRQNEVKGEDYLKLETMTISVYIREEI